MYRIAIIFALFSLLIGRLDRLFYKQNNSFNLNQILIDWSPLETFSSPLPDKVSTILDQTFSYLSKGNEFFVFISEDQSWVIKFPRLFRHRSHTKLLETLRICSTELASETAVLYAHLEQSQTGRILNLIDSFGYNHSVPLDQTPFVIQRAGTPFLDKLYDSEHPKPMIAAAVDMYRSLQKKGFVDRDPIFHKNTGWCDDHPFIFDIGSISPLEDRDSLEKMTVSLKDDLAQKRPDLLPFFQNCLR